MKMYQRSIMKEELTQEKYLKKVMTQEVKEQCPVRRTLELLSGKWRTHIIYELCKHPSMRFGELKKAYPQITNTMLTNTLRDLEKLGIVRREQFNEIPPHVEYSLTQKGKELLPVFYEMAKWGENNLEDA
ncbi:MAG: winged helix-turn-helix transcriptional regulator [Lachnospiraceae bacterium]